MRRYMQQPEASPFNVQQERRKSDLRPEALRPVVGTWTTNHDQSQVRGGHDRWASRCFSTGHGVCGRLGRILDYARPLTTSLWSDLPEHEVDLLQVRDPGVRKAMFEELANQRSCFAPEEVFVGVAQGAVEIASFRFAVGRSQPW